MALVDVRNVWKRYPGKTVLENIRLQVDEHEFVTIAVCLGHPPALIRRRSSRRRNCSTTARGSRNASRRWVNSCKRTWMRCTR